MIKGIRYAVIKESLTSQMCSNCGRRDKELGDKKRL
jgi:hypothetical protein